MSTKNVPLNLHLRCLMLPFLFFLWMVLKKAPGFKNIQAFDNAESGLEPDIWGVVLSISERYGREQR